MLPFVSEVADCPLFELLCGLMLLDPEFDEFCEPLCELMLELEEDGFWLLLDDELEVLCAAAANVNTRNANNKSRVTRFILFPRKWPAQPV